MRLPALELGWEIRLSESGDSSTLGGRAWGPGEQALVVADLIGIFGLTIVVVREKKGMHLSMVFRIL